MVDFRNPAVIEKDFLALVKFWHVLDGIFIWEFCTTLDYEWSVIRGNHPYRWTIWIYSFTRMCTLITVILNMLALNSSSPINCQLWIIFLAIFGSLAFAATSSLIILRIIAIWDMNRIAMAIAMLAWSTNVVFLILNVTQLLAAWAAEQSVCQVSNIQTSQKNILSTLISDGALLLMMLVGLLRLRIHDSMFSFRQLLWNQGVIWLFLATISEVLISLDLNGPLSLMFQISALVVMSIGATRIHRSLTNFTDSGHTRFNTHPNLRGNTTNTLANADPKRILGAPIPLNPVEVSVHTSFEHYTTVNMGQYASYGSATADDQSQDNPLVLVIGNNIKSDVKEV